MYFSNIHNPELQHFHSTIGVDFTMSLTDMLESDLFEIEDIGNNIYRVFPLFYCKTIISSNGADKILSPRCLILNKREKETYLSFRTQQDNNNIIYDDNLLNPKKINGTLSTDEFNAMVYMLRSKTTLDGTINFEDSTEFKGVYATYELENSEDIARNDIGFIITPELKRNPLTIKLTNPFFLNAKYILSCTVKSLVGANILNEDNVDYKTVDTFTVELVEDMEVGLDVTGYVEDSVLCFDMGVNVSFDVPEINKAGFTLNCESSETNILIGDSIDLTAVLGGNGTLSNYLVKFYEDGVPIGAATTDSNGVAVLPDYDEAPLGTHVYTCEVLGLSASVNVFVSKIPTSLTVESTKTVLYYGDECILTGTLLVNDSALEDLDVKVYDNNVLVDTIPTDNHGQIQYTTGQLSQGNHSFRLVYEATETRTGSESTTNLTVYSPSVTIQSSKNTAYIPTTFTVSGVLKDGNTVFKNKQIQIYNGNTLVDTITTDNNGAYSKTITADTATTYNLKAVFAEDDYTSNSEVITVTARPLNTNISINMPSSIIYTQSVNINGYLRDELNNPIRNAYVRLLQDGNHMAFAITDNTGYYQFNRQYYTPGSYTITVIHDGDGTHNGCRSNNKTLTINKAPTTSSIRFTRYSNKALSVSADVTSDYGDFNPTSVNITYNGETTTVTEKDATGNFIKTINNVPDGEHTVTVTYPGDNYYGSSTHSNSIDLSLVDAISLSKSDDGLVLNFKKSGVNAGGTLLDTIKIYQNNNVWAIMENQTADNDGNIGVILESTLTGTFHFTYRDLTSNTVTR